MEFFPSFFSLCKSVRKELCNKSTIVNMKNNSQIVIMSRWCNLGNGDMENQPETGNGNRNWKCTGAGYCTKLIVVVQVAYSIAYAQGRCCALWLLSYAYIFTDSQAVCFVITLVLCLGLLSNGYVTDFRVVCFTFTLVLTLLASNVTI